MAKQQESFFETQWRTKYCGGGQLRKTRHGRKARPLSTKDSLHVVFKAQNKEQSFRKPRSYKIVSEIIARYARRFYVRLEKLSIQGDHIHLSLRAPRRGSYQNFFRVVAGQIAQQLGHATQKFWKERPYTRVLIGQRSWKIVQDYIQLNEKEARGEIPYRKTRLKGLEPEEWEALWT